jgi:hypothetical protein
MGSPNESSTKKTMLRACRFCARAFLVRRGGRLALADDVARFGRALFASLHDERKRLRAARAC